MKGKKLSCTAWESGTGVFIHKIRCGIRGIGDAEQYNNVDLLSDFRNREFGEQYGLTILDGPLAGLLARAVIIVDANQRVTYTELVDDITNSPDYDRAIKQICS